MWKYSSLRISFHKNKKSAEAHIVLETELEILSTSCSSMRNSIHKLKMQVKV